MSLKGKLFGFAALSAWCFWAASEPVSATAAAPALAKGLGDQAMDFVSGVASGVVGNLAHEGFNAADEAYFARLFSRHPDIDENHHILAAMRASHLAALGKVLDNFEAARPNRMDEHENFFVAALRSFMADAEKTGGAATGDDEVPIFTRLPSAFEKALAERGTHARHDGEAWRRMLAAEVLEDALASAKLAADDIPGLFLSAFHGSKSGRDGWFDLFVRDASARLKNNEAFKSIWTAEQFARMKAMLGQALESLNRIETTVNQIAEKVAGLAGQGDHLHFGARQLWRIVEKLVAAGTKESDLPQALEAAVDSFVAQGGRPHQIHNESPLLDRAIQEARAKLAALDATGALKTLDDALAADDSYELALKAEEELRAHRVAMGRARASIYFEKADILRPLYQHEAVITALEAGLELDRSQTSRWYELGDELNLIGRRTWGAAAYREGGRSAERAGNDRDLSVSHARLGNVLIAEGNLPAARRAYEDALAIRQRLAATDPGNTQWQSDLSVCNSKLGDVLVSEGNLLAARKAFEGALAICLRLAADDPSNTKWQRDLAIGHAKLGDILIAEGNLPAARKAYEHALTICKRLAAADPGHTQWQRDLSISRSKLGDVLISEGNLPAARNAFEDTLAIRQRLAAADPGNTQWQRDLSIIHNKLGDVLLAEGNLPAARGAYEDTLVIRQKLAAADPGNTQWQRDLSVSHSKLGDALIAEGDLPTARKAYKDVLVVRERLAAVDPSNAGWQRDLSVAYHRLGDVLIEDGNFSDARRAYLASLAIDEKLVAIDPTNAQWQDDLRISRATIANLPPK